MEHSTRSQARSARPWNPMTRTRRRLATGSRGCHTLNLLSPDLHPQSYSSYTSSCS
uniref:Uncharacterized protein n=1 Tax=Zea mays TaxID=4577 RepID=C0PJY1_MAIZE|nr:unknown [Zea mays]